MSTEHLPLCRHRGAPVLDSRWICHSTKLYVPLGHVSTDTCLSGCPCVDHEWEFEPSELTTGGTTVAGSMGIDAAESARGASNGFEWKPELLSIGMMSAPRSERTIERSISELQRAGFTQTVHVFEEPGTNVAAGPGVFVTTNSRRLGLWKNWLSTAHSLLDNTDAPFLLICEDDIRLADSAAGLLQHVIETQPHNDWGYASLYTPRRNIQQCRPVAGWQAIDIGAGAWGALAYCFTRESLKAVLDSETVTGHRGDRETDRIVSWSLQILNRKRYFHLPSLCEHAGAGISTLDHLAKADSIAIGFSPHGHPDAEGEFLRPGAGSTATNGNVIAMPIKPDTASTTVDCDVAIVFAAVDAKWAPQAIESILNQVSAAPIVHIVADGTFEETETVTSRFKGVRNVRLYYNRDSVGPFVTYHRLFDHLETDLFAVLDADDIALPHRLWYSIVTMRRVGADAFCGAMEQFVDHTFNGDLDLKRALLAKPHHWPGRKFRSCPSGAFINSTSVWHTELIRRLGGWPDWRGGNDSEFSERAIHSGYKLWASRAVVALRRFHRTSLSNSPRHGGSSQYREAVTNEIARRIRLFQRQFDPRMFGTLDAHRASHSLIKIT